GRRHPAGRGGHLGGRTDRDRRPGRAARGARPGRRRLPPPGAARAAGRPDPAAAGRRRGPLPAAPRRTDGRRGHRVRRRPLPALRGAPDAGDRMRSARPPMLRVGSAVALPLHPRSLLWTLLLLAALLAAAAATLCLGRLGIPLPELAGALTGDASPAQTFVLNRLRGPRLVVALGTGAALGLAGALFQSVTR